MMLMVTIRRSMRVLHRRAEIGSARRRHRRPTLRRSSRRPEDERSVMRIRRTTVHFVLVVCTAAGALAALVAHAAPAAAAGPGCQDGDIEVTTNADAGTGSLRAAFATASTVAGPSRVCVSTTVAGPIVLTTGELLYNAGTTPGLTLEGNGITVSGNNASRVINNDTAGSLTLHHVTITGGNTSSADGGGGIVSAGATNIIDSVIAGNTATTGGGVKLR